ncbi:MAG TPA: ABC transporter ATP-binding protein [Phycisphaerae bacterium]|nr:ABC transporter ATP-binding protein [Phycisphaerae bacterium]HRW52222.1 ABC transporter ATP-binding protein [Phycisphaerae bacterium]
MGDKHIHLDDISLTFRVHSARTYSIKETIVNYIARRKYTKPVTIVQAIQHLTLHVPNGQRLGIIGDNGSGKSSLLKVMSRIYPPTSGRVDVNGFLVPLLEVGIGFNPELSGVENIFLTGAIMGLNRRVMATKVDAIFDFCELRDFADTPLKYYSSGMAQRLAFAVATEVDPEILLLDEIFSAGDIHWMERAQRRMKALIDRTRILVLVSHQMELIERYCDRAIWMRKGEIVMDGSPSDLVAAYRATAEQAPEPTDNDAAAAV